MKGTNNMKIFLSGGYSNLPREEATHWRQLIKEANYNKYQEVQSYNSSPISIPIIINPTELYIPPKTYDPLYEKEAMQYDLYHVRTSDVIIVNFNSLSSIGTAQEIMLAYTLNIPIIGLIPEDKYSSLHPWYKEECIKIFKYNNTEEDLNRTFTEIIRYCWERFK